MAYDQPLFSSSALVSTRYQFSLIWPHVPTNQVSLWFYLLNCLLILIDSFCRFPVVNTTLYPSNSAFPVLRILLLCLLRCICSNAGTRKCFKSRIVNWRIYGNILFIAVTFPGSLTLSVPQIKDHHLTLWHLHTNLHYLGCHARWFSLCGEDGSSTILLSGKLGTAFFLFSNI